MIVNHQQGAKPNMWIIQKLKVKTKHMELIQLIQKNFQENILYYNIHITPSYLLTPKVNFAG